MAEIKPFRGIRYNLEAVGDLSLVVSPVYDIIDEAGRDALYNRHPYNVIRLILNRAKKNDTEPDAPYRRAGEFFERWLAQRILIRDPEPCIYLYRQRYLLEGEFKECTGYVARVRVEEFSEGGILPHEDIMPKPLEDRVRLLEQTRANFSMVHTIYSDPAERLKKPVLSETEKFPLAQFQTGDGIAHDLWGVSDPRFIKKLSDFFAGRKLYIADGHHRYQTACLYSRKLREAGAPEDDPGHYLMMMIVEMENPGLSLLPAHRVVRDVEDYDERAFLDGLGRWFAVSEIEVPDSSRSGQVYGLLHEIAHAGKAGRAFGLLMRDPERSLLLRWKSELDVKSAIEGDYSSDYKELDVTVLHRLVLEGLLGLPPDRESVEENLVFTRDHLEAAREVDSGRARMAFLMNPPRVGQVKGVADHGERMPQKSTYFHPKPCSGVVINRITEW